MSDARKELARLLVSKMIDFSLVIPDYEQLADLMARGVLSAGYSKRTPGGEAERDDAIDACVLALGPGASGCEAREALDRLYDDALSTRPAGESAGVAEAPPWARQSSGYDEALRRYSDLTGDAHGARVLSFTAGAQWREEEMYSKGWMPLAARASQPSAGEVIVDEKAWHLGIRVCPDCGLPLSDCCGDMYPAGYKL